MKKITTIAVLILIAFVISIVWYKATFQYKPVTNEIIVGTTADFPPFSFRDKNDNITGFDIDIVKEVARRLGKDIKILDRPFAMLLPQIQLGQIHMIAAGMTPTEQRAKKVNFTKPYLNENPILVITLKDKSPEITSLDDLKGKDVIVNTGYTADIYMSKIPGINLIRLPKVADAFTALNHGKAYAFATASFTIKPYLDSIKENKNKFSIFTVDDTDEITALAVSKKLPQEFFESVQTALDQMETDGTLFALKQKWELT